MLKKEWWKKRIKFNNIQKYIGFPLLFVFFVFLIIGPLLLNNIEKIREIPTCGDKTIYNECSLRQPYFCLDGNLIEKASICNCSEILTKDNESCISKYQTDAKNITLKYILRGEKKEINFTVYNGMVEYMLYLPKFINHSEEEKPSRRDFKLRNINEEEQRELLLPLITKIQNIAKTKEDQVRIVISIVQHILYEESGNVLIFNSNQVLNYSKYPYEVLYDMKGVCGSKSELLAFLLQEMGYGVVLFYYPLENHETVGIKCPIEYSLNNTGYCFIETTKPSIITNNQDYYIGAGKLSSNPKVIFITKGNSLGENLYEYKDAKDLIKINKIIEKKEELNPIEHYKLERLKKKYNLYFLYSK